MSSDNDVVVYHVTYVAALDSIAEHGLLPEAIGLWEGGAYGGHSQNRIFLTEEDGVRFWYNIFRVHAEDTDDDVVETGQVPVVLSVMVDDDSLVEDPAGTRDAKYEAYYTTTAIPPENILLWDGSEWVVPDDGVDATIAVEYEEYGPTILDRAFGEPNPLAEPDFNMDWQDT